jgi:hypothetical protein
VVVVEDVAPVAYSGHTVLDVGAAVLVAASAVHIAVVVADHVGQTRLESAVAVRIEVEVAAACTDPVAVAVPVVAKDAERPWVPGRTGLEAVAAAEHLGSLAHRNWGPHWVLCI